MNRLEVLPFEPRDDEAGPGCGAPPGLKVDINQLLWTHLPPSTSLGLADRIAVEFFDRVVGVWDEHNVLQARAQKEKSDGFEPGITQRSGRYA